MAKIVEDSLILHYKRLFSSNKVMDDVTHNKEIAARKAQVDATSSAGDAVTPLVSVLMPAYNQRDYVSEALDSLLAQTYGRWEAIVVDDGSPDDVAEVVGAYVKKDSRIKFFHTENHGLPGARNFAVTQANGEFLLPLDADDTIEPTYLEKCIAEFAARPEAEAVYCQWHLFGAVKKTKPIYYKGYKSLLLCNSLFVTTMIRRQRFLEVGGYDESMRKGLEDWEFWLRYLDEDSMVIQIPQPLLNYRIKAQSMITDAMSTQKRFDIEYYIMGKHREKYAALFGSPITTYSVAERLAKKYYGMWYKRLWRKLRGR